jgi:glycine/D-amino acid oxidase-like deaminating enzyme
MNHQPSIWEQETWLAPCDLAIVGGGLLGMWTAIELKSKWPSARITLLERSTLPAGASTRNAGFACFGSPSELWADYQSHGLDAMIQTVMMRYHGIHKMRRMLGDEAISFEPCGGYECFLEWNTMWVERIAQINQWLSEAMATDHVFTHAHHKIASMGMRGFEGMVQTSAEGAIHPGRLVARLQGLLQELGVQLLYGAEVKEWSNTGAGWRVHTTSGTVDCGQILITANAFIPGLVQAPSVRPARGQVLVTKPLPGLRLRGTFHFDEGFYYWRHLGEHSLLLGGARNAAFEEEETTAMQTTATVQKKLEEFLNRHFADYFDAVNTPELIEMRWAGIMGMSGKKEPELKQTEPGVWAALSCNGMGVAMTPVFAEWVAKEILTNW